MGFNYSPPQLFIIRTSTLITGLFVVIFIFLNFLYGDVSSLTSSASTGFRLSLFLILWRTTWWCMQNAFGEVTSKELAAHGWGSSLSKGALWGGVNGILIWTGIVLFGLSTLSLSMFLMTIVGGTLVILIVGLPFAFVTGSCVGVLGMMIVKLLIGMSYLRAIEQ